MALMHRKTFELKRGSKTSVVFPGIEDYVEVDDSIALLVQLLNRKGYHTHTCCSGHPFWDMPLAAIQHLSKTNAIKSEFGINFQPGVSLPNVPDGFSLRKIEEVDILNIYMEKPYDFTGKHEYNYMRYALDVAEKLHEWALGLPDAKAGQS